VQPEKKKYPDTPDGRYFVVKGRLWRKTNPNLPETARKLLVSSLMDARRNIKKFRDNPHRLRYTRSQVHSAKIGLGERGQVWWNDGAPDQNRKLVKNSTYRNWWTRSGYA